MTSKTWQEVTAFNGPCYPPEAQTEIDELRAALKAQPVKHVNYEPLHKFATDNRVSYNELCTAVHAALSQWQPIETAPKDGSKYLVWAGGLGMAYYKSNYVSGYPHNGPFSDNLSAWSNKATHWMPLPKGPV